MRSRIAGWLGAAAITAAPFFIDYDSGKILAMIGLSLLTLQSIQLKAWNIATANIIGIGGYFYALYI